MDYGFLAGMGCGVCLGLSIIAFQKYLVPKFIGKSATPISKFTNSMEPKVVLVVRTDLNMGKGKIAAQCAHAAVSIFEKASKHEPSILKFWQRTGQAKVALKIDNADDLLELQKEAKRRGIITAVIRDAGRTQIAPNSITVLGIGPAPKNVIDEVTGHLKLL